MWVVVQLLLDVVVIPFVSIGLLVTQAPLWMAAFISRRILTALASLLRGGHTVPTDKDGKKLKTIHASNAMWLQDNRLNMSIINSVTFLKTRMKVEDYKAALAKTFAEFTEFSSVPVLVGGTWYWSPASLDVDKQVYVHDSETELSQRELEARLRPILSKPLPRDRPLWAYHFFPKYKGGGSVLLFRVHHTVGDGLALVRFFLEKLSDKSDQKLPSLLSRSIPKFVMFLYMVKVLLHGPWRLVASALRPMDRNCLKVAKCTGMKSVSWSPSYSLKDVSTIRKVYGCSINDVMTVCLQGALSKHLEKSGAPAAGISTTIPVSMRSASRELVLDNQIGFIHPYLETSPSTDEARVRKTSALMSALTHSVDPMASYLTIRLSLACFPDFLTSMFLDFLADKVSAVFTNVPGPRGPVSTVGYEIEDLLFFVNARSSIACGFSFFSYNGRWRVGLQVDDALKVDPTDLIKTFDEEWRRLVAAHSKK